VVRDNTTIDADSAEYLAVEDIVKAHGNVRMQRNGDCYSGDVFQMQLDTGQVT
jgi:lipopolysaccharide assembly outer membrane protein LptD (OstA)